jgi:hypothetical protein
MENKIDPKRERYIVFVLILIVLSIPVLSKVELKPAKMRTAEDAYSYLSEKDHKLSGSVVVAVDFGPGTSAENLPQVKVVIEHLMRKRIPFALTTLYVLASPYLKDLPLEIMADLKKEDPSQTWEYGKDWVNLGYFSGGGIQLQSLAKSDDWKAFFKFDAYGTPMSDIPVMDKFRKISDVSALVQITGLQGVLSAWLQYFRNGNNVPKIIHGCTSISIPEAFAFYSSGQLTGLFEGIAGAAWYEQRMREDNANRTLNLAQTVNTGVSFAQILIVVLVIFGNLKRFIWRA